MGWRSDEEAAIKEHFAEDERRRAEAMAALTDVERRWIARMKRTIRDMPDTLYILAADMGGVTFYRGAPDCGCEVDAVFDGTDRRIRAMG